MLSHTRGGHGSEVDSGRILHFCQTRFIKCLKKTDPESSLIFVSSRCLRGLHTSHCSSTNIAEYRLHRWLAEFEQESDFQIWKKFGPGCRFKNLEPECRCRSQKMWRQPPLPHTTKASQSGQPKAFKCCTYWTELQNRWFNQSHRQTKLLAPQIQTWSTINQLRFYQLF